jgi:hypothetical protein
MTHHNATFFALSTEGEELFVGISGNGETSTYSFGEYGTALTILAPLIRREVREGVDAHRPLIVVIGKNRGRATSAEGVLLKFALKSIREVLDTLPVYLVADFAGEVEDVAAEYYSPRVASLPLPWAKVGTPTCERVNALLESLSATEEGLALLPKGYTYAER